MTCIFLSWFHLLFVKFSKLSFQVDDSFKNVAYKKFKTILLLALLVYVNKNGDVLAFGED